MLIVFVDLKSLRNPLIWGRHQKPRCAVSLRSKYNRNGILALLMRIRFRPNEIHIKAGRPGVFCLAGTIQISTLVRPHRSCKSLILWANVIQNPVAMPLNPPIKRFVEIVRWPVMSVSTLMELGRTVGLCNVNVSDNAFVKLKAIWAPAHP